MTKEVEVGDEFNGKVVKTTTFGAFVELAKGTDGLLHISNVSPGERAATVEDVLNKGDEVDVRVVEVDRERGRIGLRLADDPEIAGKTVEELAAVGTGGNGGGRGATATAAARGDRGPRGGGDRDRGGARRPRPRGSGRPRHRSASTATPTAAERRTAVLDEHRLTELESGVRVVTEANALRAIRGARLLDRHGLVAPRTTPEAGLSHLLEHMLFRGTDALRLAARSTRSSTPWAPSSTRARARRRRRSTPACSTTTSPRAFDVMADMVWRPRFDAGELAPSARSCSRRSRCTRTTRRTRSSTSSARPSSATIRSAARSSAAREVVGAHAAPSAARPSTPRATCPANVVVAAAGSVDHDALVELVARRPGRAPRRGARRRCRRRRRATPPRVRFVARTPSSTTSASARPGIAARRRAPLRAARARQHPRRHVVVAAVPGGPRAARPGLRRLLVPVAVRRDRARSASTSARGPTTSCAALGVVADELERLREDPAHAPTSSRARKENVKGRIVLSLESTAARMNRLGASVLADMPLLSRRRGDRAHRRRDARRHRRARARAVRARALQRRGHRPRRGASARARADLPAWARPRVSAA